MIRKWIPVLLMVFLWIPPVNAEYYRFVDKNGTVRFTDNLADVPEDQREKVRGFQGEEEQQTAEPKPADAQPEAEKSIETDTDIATGENPSITAEDIKTEKSLDTGTDTATGAKPSISVESIKKTQQELDREYADLSKERKALTEEKETLKTVEEHQAHNEKVEALNKRLEAFREKQAEQRKNVSELNKQIESFNKK